MKLANLIARATDPATVARLRVPAVLLLAGLVVGFFSPGTWSFAATFAITQALLALSVGMLFGRAGLLSLCPLAFAAIGAWVVLWFNVNFKMPFVIMVLLGALAAVPAGVLVGGLALRLRGVNLAVVTLAFSVAISGIFSRHNFPGTVDAVYRPLRPAGFTSDRMYFLLSFVILIAVGIGLEALGRTRTGQAWRAVRSSERATAAAGLSVPRVKLSAFVTSAAIAGLAGGMFAAQLQGSVDIRSFNAILSLAVVAAAVMFGAQSLSGAVFAGTLAALIPEVFRRLGWSVEYPQMLFGLGAIQALSQGGNGISAAFPWRQPVRSTADRPPAPLPLAVAQENTATDSSTALEIDELSVVYGSLKALDRVSLSVPDKAIVGIIGPNGAGKSTLIDAVCGFIDHYTGTLRLKGAAIDSLGATKRARAGLRRTFQQGRAIPELEVGDYIRLYSPTPISDDQLAEVLGFFGLPPADEPIEFVDVGTRRVLEVAASVAARPVVAFLDEPAAGLGTDETNALADHIREIPARFGCSVVLIEHDVEMVAAVCSHITVIDFGRVIASGKPGDVLDSDVVRAAYIGAELDDDLVTAVALVDSTSRDSTTADDTKGDGEESAEDVSP